MATAQELRQASEALEDQAEAREESENDIEALFENLKRQFVVKSEYEIVRDLSKTYKINATEARKAILDFPPSYKIYNHTIPDVIKTMRKERRNLKGEYRDKMTKNIDALIDGYSEHIDKCIDSIYWLSPYKTTLKKMNFKETDLKKLHTLKEATERRTFVDHCFARRKILQSQFGNQEEYLGLYRRFY